MPDAVVIGAGPNGLVAANLLADAGWAVVVLEASDRPGGAVRTEELILPGFHHDVFSAFYPLAAASPAITGLELEAYGLRWRQAPLVLAHPLRDGRCAALSNDREETAASLEQFASGDGAAWLRIMDEWDRVGDGLLRALFSPFPPVRPAVGLLARLGVQGTLHLARHALLPVRRMAEEAFAGEGGGLLLGGNALHTDLPPESALSGMFGWLLCCLGQQYGFPVPEGGAGALTTALVRRLASKGGIVRCGEEVASVVIHRGRAVAVRTTSGGEVTAGRAVLADVSAPELFGKLVSGDQLPPAFVADVGRFQWDASTVKVDWALSEPIPWSAGDARRAGTVHVADDFDNFTEFAAELAMGRLPRRPFLLVGQQSRADPSRSPAGTETAWAYTHVPRTVRADGGEELTVDGGTAAWLGGFVRRMEARIEALAPGFGARVLGRHVLGPVSMEERDANLVGGAINGGTSQLHQQLVFRPVPGMGRPETPVAGLYLASASAHPGGGVHGGPGANAARAALLPGVRARSVVFGRGRPRSTR